MAEKPLTGTRGAAAGKKKAAAKKRAAKKKASAPATDDRMIGLLERILEVMTQQAEVIRSQIAKVPDHDGENLLSPTAVKLYGVPFIGLEVCRTNKVERDSAKNDRVAAGKVGATGLDSRVKNDLERILSRADASLARIYAFTYEGVLHMLPRPTVFLVVGEGRSTTGDDMIAARDWNLGVDIKKWEVDRYDMGLRLDIESGLMEDILLGPVLGTGSMAGQGELVGRGELTGRGELVGRGAGGEMVGRGEMVTRHRFRR